MKPDSDDTIQDGAIDPDVPKDVKTEESDTDPRAESYDAIVNKVEQERIEEMDIEVEPEPEPDPEPDPEPEKKPEPDPEPPEELVKIVVDGKESEVPLSKILDAGKRTFQKESAADASLAEAKKVLKEVQELKARLQTPEPKPDEDVSDMADGEYLEAIRYGSDEEGTGAIRALRGQGLSIEDIMAKVKQAIREEVPKTVEDEKYKPILGRFNKTPEEGGYSDILDDELLLGLAHRKVNELIKNGEGDDLTWETYQKAGDWVRETILGQKPVKKPAETIEDRKDKKRKIDSITPAASVTTDDATTKDHEATLAETRADTIANMRAQREAQL